jgi:hypothetical protein
MKTISIVTLLLVQIALSIRQETLIARRPIIKPYPLPTPLPPVKKCYANGADICSDSPGQVCYLVYREVFQCYKPELCQNIKGECRWLETAEFLKCKAQYEQTSVVIDDPVICPYPVDPIEPIYTIQPVRDPPVLYATSDVMVQ